MHWLVATSMYSRVSNLLFLPECRILENSEFQSHLNLYLLKCICMKKEKDITPLLFKNIASHEWVQRSKVVDMYRLHSLEHPLDH